MGSKKKRDSAKKTGRIKKGKKSVTKTIKKKTRSKTKKKKASTAKKSLSALQCSPSRTEAIKTIKAQLLAQKKVLLGEAGATLNNMPAAVLYPDLGDQAGMEIERNFLLRLRGREQKLLKKIDEALERIENGTFGLCEICGREIDIRRLMARPVTTMCIECKTEQEEEERLREM